MVTSRNQATASNARATAVVATFLEQLVKITGDPTMPLQQVRLLLALRIHGTLNQANLEEHTGVKKSSNGRNIDRLGEGSVREPGLGYLESYDDQNDRRFKLVRLTPKGLAVMDDAASQVAKYLGS